eukprot:2077703-Rhodomonas_salina.4
MPCDPRAIARYVDLIARYLPVRRCEWSRRYQVKSAICLRAPYEMPGIIAAYEMSSTDRVCHATRPEPTGG